MADPRAGIPGLDMLGVAPSAAEALAALAPGERQRLAAVPVPLARLAGLPSPLRVAEQPPLPARLDPGWRLAAEFFAAGLLTYLWQLARHQPVAAALCVGPSPGRVEQLARLSFADIQSCVSVAAPQLRARRVFGPERLGHLLRSVRAGASGRRAPGLDLIPLGLAGLRPRQGPRQPA